MKFLYLTVREEERIFLERERIFRKNMIMRVFWGFFKAALVK